MARMPALWGQRRCVTLFGDETAGRNIPAQAQESVQHDQELSDGPQERCHKAVEGGERGMEQMVVQGAGGRHQGLAVVSRDDGTHA